MNVKTLAFEVNPVNKGASVNSLGSSQVGSSFSGDGSFIQQIEDRLRARAGNPAVVKNSAANFNIEKTNKNETALGTGISESEVQKIIKEFSS